MPQTKPLSTALELQTYLGERTVAFTLVGTPTDVEMPTTVHVPISIAFRLHYLGRAFDGQVVKLIKPAGMTRVDYIQLQRLIEELELVAETTKDPVSQHYLSQLLPLLSISRKYPTSSLNVIGQ
jgi:hypothetical protein